MTSRRRSTKRPKPLTASAIVALNFRRIREERGWSQAEAGRRLARVTGRPWSVATVSGVERSWERGPERAFGVNELDAISLAFGVSLLELLLPPSREETARRLPPRWTQRLLWTDARAVQTRAAALAHDTRSAELLDRLAGGEKALRLGVKKARRLRLAHLATKLRETAAELEMPGRMRW